MHLCCCCISVAVVSVLQHSSLRSYQRFHKICSTLTQQELKLCLLQYHLPMCYLLKAIFVLHQNPAQESCFHRHGNMYVTFELSRILPHLMLWSIQTKGKLLNSVHWDTKHVCGQMSQTIMEQNWCQKQSSGLLQQTFAFHNIQKSPSAWQTWRCCKHTLFM